VPDRGHERPEPPRSWIARGVRFVSDHPKTSLVIGAGLGAGAEIVAAALVGGALALLWKRDTSKP
jgi:hypothetical protein